MVDALARPIEDASPRARIERLFDSRSFEFVHLAPSGPITGFGMLSGRWAAAIADDPQSPGDPQAALQVAEIARRQGMPLVWLGASATFEAGPLGVLARLRREVPTVVAGFGAVAGELVLESQLADLSIALQLPSRGAQRQPAWDVLAADEPAMFRCIRDFLAMLPSRSGVESPARPPVDPPLRSDEELSRILPERSDLAYDVKAILIRVLDEGRYLEMAGHQGNALVLAIARLGGRSLGIMAWQPKASERSLTLAVADRAERFLDTCAAFNLPLLVMPDEGMTPSAWQSSLAVGSRLVGRLGRGDLNVISLAVRPGQSAASILAQAATRAVRSLAWRAVGSEASATDQVALIEARHTRRHLLRALEIARGNLH